MNKNAAAGKELVEVLREKFGDSNVKVVEKSIENR
jgi:hypothetical protein